MAKKKSQPARRRPKTLKQRDRDHLHEIDELMSEGEHTEAIESIIRFTRKNPNVVEGWLLQFQIGDFLGYNAYAWIAAENLVKLVPDEEDHLYNLILTCLKTSMFASALSHIERFYEQFVYGGHRSTVDEMRTFVENALKEEIEANPILETIDRDTVIMQERGQILIKMSEGDTREGRKFAQIAAKKYPDWTAPQLDIVDAYLIEGKLDKALEQAQQVFEQHPDDLEVQCEYIQMMIRMGRQSEVQPLIDGIHRDVASNSQLHGKIIETLAFANQPQSIIDYFTRLDEETQQTFITRIMHHVAAAYAQTGDLETAQTMWNAEIEDGAGDLSLVRENLNNVSLEPADRNGAWLLSTFQLIPTIWRSKMERALRNRITVEDAHRTMNRIIDSTPGFESTIALLLRQGNHNDRLLALEVAAARPIEGLVEFATGTSGTDQHRWIAALHALKHGLLESNQTITMYQHGEPEEILLMDYNIDFDDDDTPETISDEYWDLVAQAEEAIDDGEYELALELTEQALEMTPDDLPLHNQKFSVLRDLERDEEARQQAEFMLEKFPDSMVSTLATVELERDAENYDKVQEMLAPLERQQDLTLLEFESLAHNYIQLYLALEQKSNARRWITRWQQINPFDVPFQYTILNMSFSDMQHVFANMSPEQQEQFLQMLREGVEEESGEPVEETTAE